MTDHNRVVQPSTRRTAFTLVETVVVTAALALALGQLVPAARTARSASLLAGCRDRLGQIAKAGLVYASEDASEFATPIGAADGDPSFTQLYTSYFNYGGKSGLGPGLDANQSLFSGPFGMGAMHRPLNKILFKEQFGPPPVRLIGRIPKQDWNRDGRHDLDVYHCPADNGFPGMHYRGWRDSGLSGYDYFGTSYITNVLMAGGRWQNTVSTYRRPLSAVPSPANTVLYMETAARFAQYATNPDLDQDGNCWLQPFGDIVPNGWHGTPYRFVVGFADGGAADVEIKGWGRTSTPQIMPPSCPGTFCECLMIRGPGWRMDTFPADFIPTTKRWSTGSSDPVWDVVP